MSNKITKTSKKGIDLIKKYEGFRSEPYLCPANIATTINWNIGSPPGTFAYTFLN
jgi:GH24 family phage-related lysozyme (muramidase)